MCVHVFEMHKKTGGLNRLHDAKASLLKCYSSHVLGGHPVFLVKRRTTPPGNRLSSSAIADDGIAAM